MALNRDSGLPEVIAEVNRQGGILDVLEDRALGKKKDPETYHVTGERHKGAFDVIDDIAASVGELIEAKNNGGIPAHIAEAERERQKLEVEAREKAADRRNKVLIQAMITVGTLMTALITGLFAWLH